ncbi:xanthine dehydrogenase family protein molybdopterin-binding subunit [Sphingomonas sp. S1-29]|uniref:xanthine dehydrogenase family protein molybdopterin-binding subunit n=1 Tax=Sphingomonas sp. S1-29 TaxID=2991074 RepID=UPI00223EC774|nr:xanthine dehydrogenase family protein molybdopterin-binding subunit [Sphingomonas sp. S1-29]UZK68228.1 xanthine dehydrogenase family protein molybdopterin-binding subunit [Sphingomonas sp. S1-29]
MKFDTPAGINPIDQERVVGQPHTRVEGPLKVTGRATYAYEYHDVGPNVAYGVMRGAGIAKGRITSIDVREAEAAPGVLLVLTYQNVPKQATSGRGAVPQLQGPEIKHFDQSVAFVVAETFEQARAAANLVRIDYAQAKGAFELAQVKDQGKPVADAPDVRKGDFAGAFAKAEFKVDETYTTPDESHAMMEPQASIALWEGDRLTVRTSHQIVHWATRGIAATLQIPEANVRVLTPYVGGGFGSKLFLYSDPILAALAARELGRPVKVALTRPQIFNHTSHRPATIQRVRLAANGDGKLTAVGHMTWSGNLPDAGSENASEQTKLMYGGENRLIETRLSVLDLPRGAAMRAPGEAVGLLALESAIDELAEKIGMDPVAFRIANDVQYDPSVGPSRPFSTRMLVECLRTGAEKFGWDRRNPKPAQVRDGDWLVGIGVASALRNNLMMPSGARVRMGSDGILIVETQMTDIGTGSYTVLAAVGAEMLGLPIERVQVRLGDSDFPRSAGSGGSWGANSASAGLYYACENLRAALAQKAGFNTAEVTFEGGNIVAGGRSVPLGEAAGPDGVVAEGDVTFGDLDKKYAQAGFGAHFIEAGVNIHTGEVRVRRALSVCAAGRIINPIAARSQCLGGVTMGIGAALMEECVVDKRFGYFVNHDLAEYHVPVHADIPDIDVIFLDELDDKSSPIKAKGVGELGICGVGGAVANAVYNACGVRVREFPITLDKILPGLPRYDA